MENSPKKETYEKELKNPDGVETELPKEEEKTFNSSSEVRRKKIQKEIDSEKTVTYILPDKDKYYLSKASQSVENLKKMLKEIKAGVLKFDGQYKEARCKEAVAYLTRTIEERN